MQLDTHFPRNHPAPLGGIVHDAAAGTNLALAMLPKAMAYAAVAGVPPAYGLYASCAAPVLGVAFGSNRLQPSSIAIGSAPFQPGLNQPHLLIRLLLSPVISRRQLVTSHYAAAIKPSDDCEGRLIRGQGNHPRDGR